MNLGKMSNILWIIGLILMLVAIVFAVANGISDGQNFSEIVTSNIVMIIAFVIFGAMRIFLFKGDKKGD